MALAALLAIQGAPKYHVETLAEKRRLNIFEAAMKIETAEKNTLPGYAL